jgi:AcrR family transcriptional regulator|tara:strand:- start:715 stop:1374 length:660 start_codon:yes stop_codon:yes gene_type:complete
LLAKIEPPKRKTRSILLDTAEEQFATYGYDGVSIRSITEAAKVNLGSVNYFFASKEGLYFEVIARRASTLAAARLSQLNANLPAVGDDSHQISVRKIVSAFIEPALKLSMESASDWTHYHRLVAQASVHCWEPPYSTAATNSFNSVALVFINALKDSLPSTDERTIHYAYSFMLSSTLTALSQNGRLDALSKDKYKSSDIAPISKSLIKFITAGIIGLT